ncbi:YkgJ family cysteine cluster protein [Candidatus Poribacteria bacterium]|nr:YkgJ family cysteine cluster protein [Candidatus Poribacteria bacterium]
MPKPVMEQYHNLIKEADLDVQKLRAKRGGSPCPSTCFECCKNTATMPISEVEAQELKKGLKKLPEEIQAHILKKANRSIRKLEQSGYTHEQMTIGAGMEATKILKGKPEGECPMLIGGVCSVYDHRPVICRVWGYPIDNGNELACCHKTFIGQRGMFKPIDYVRYWRECQDLSQALGAERKTPNCYLIVRLLNEEEKEVENCK